MWVVYLGIINVNIWGGAEEHLLCMIKYLQNEVK